MNDHDTLLEVDDVSVSYGSIEVLQNISLRVERGQFACLIGPNGAGKSTLLQAIIGLVPVSRGRVTTHTPNVGYVPQQLRLDAMLPLSVAEFLALKVDDSAFWSRRRISSVRERIHRQLEEIGATHLIDRKLGRLSGGEFQRILIAYALLNEPDLLLLDEPLTGIDIRGGLSFDGLLHHLHDHRGITVLMVSHDLHLVEHLSDIVFCINRDLCCHGPARDVLRPENLARAYGHIPGMVQERQGTAFIPVRNIH